MKKETKEAIETHLEKKAKSGAQMAVASEAGMFFDEEVVSDSNDIMIPRLLLMHGTSVLVGQGQAAQGDIINSVSVEVLANAKKTVEVIPIKQLDKAWVVETYNGKKFEFERVDPWNSDLSNQLEFEEEGKKKRRNARLSFYVLLARDAGSNHLPYMVSFQRTSYKAGKNLASFFQEAKFAFKEGDKGSIPMRQVFELGCHVEQGDNGAYFVFDAKRTRIASDPEKQKAIYWFSQLRSKTYKVHEETAEPATEEKTEREF